MKASDWWVEFLAAVEWADMERSRPNGLVGPDFAVQSEELVKDLGGHSAYRAINQGQRIASGARAVEQGRNLDLSCLRSGHSADGI